MHTHPLYGNDYGDTPLVYSTKLTFRNHKVDYFTQYQSGIKDYPYHQLRVGVSFQFEKLTPKYLR